MTSIDPSGRPVSGMILPRFALLLAVLPVAGMLISCDASEADQSQVETAIGQLAAGDAQGVVTTLEGVATASESSDPIDIQAAATLGDAHMAIGHAAASELQTKLLEASRLTFEVQQLMGVAEVGVKLVDGYKLVNPAESKAAIAAMITEAQGGTGQDAWNPTPDTQIPTLAATSQEVSALQAKIATHLEKLSALTARRNAALTEASKLLESSAQAKGQDAVALFSQASAARKRASDISTEIEVAQAQLLPLQENLAIGLGRQSKLQTFIAEQQRRLTLIDQGQTARLSRVDGQLDVSRAALRQEQNASINAKAAELTGVLTEAVESKDRAVAAFAAAKTAYTKAQSSAEQLARLKTRADEIREKDPISSAAINARIKAFAVPVYRSAAGKSDLAAASTHAAYASALSNLQATMTRLTPLASTLGVELPPVLVQYQADLSAQLTDARAKASEGFEAAAEGTAVVTAANDPRRNSFRVTNIIALFMYSQFLRETGQAEPADQRLKEAAALAEELQSDGVTDFSDLPAAVRPKAKPPEAPPAETPAPAEAPPAEPAPGN